MSKKSRRTRLKNKTTAKKPTAGPIRNIEPPKSAVAPEVVVSSKESPSSPSPVSRHQYILPELRRISIVAGALFVILIILTFILG